jgi:cohesin loading factor subunit SCC2
LSSLIKLSDSKQKAGLFRYGSLSAVLWACDLIALTCSLAVCRLRDGRSIKTISALLLQLIQTSAHDVKIEAERLRRERQRNQTFKRGDSTMSIEGDGSKQAFLDEADHEVRKGAVDALTVSLLT